MHLLVRALTLASTLALAGCAAPTKPYVTVTVVPTFPPHDELAWFADGPQMVCWAHNPTAERVDGAVRCLEQEESYGERDHFPVTLEPHEDRAVGICQVMNKDVHARPCWFSRKP